MLSDKGVAVITGSSKGIGAATAIRLADDGFRVIVNYSASEARAREVVQRIEAKHGAGRAIAVKASMASLSEVSVLAEKSLEFGTVKFLLCNAGVAPVTGIQDVTPENYDEVFSTNFKGHLFLVKALSPKMPPGSSIAFTSGGITVMTNVPDNFLLYNASKGAMEQMSRVLAKELGKRQIRVNVVRPGPIISDMLNATLESPDMGPLMKKEFQKMSPMNRIGEPEDVADVFSFLAGNDSRWVSGQAFSVDGGALV